jgi:predicted phage terminase large subunit-like protein
MEANLIQEIQKLSLEDFLSFLETVKSEAEKQDFIIIRCATDLELFAQIFFPHYCTRAFNDFHRHYFNNSKYGERDFRRASAAPRGSAKSTLGTLIKPIHDACYGLEKFILILSSTAPLANKKLKDIRAEIQTNSYLIAAYGIRFPKKKVGESEFTVISDKGRTYFQAIGRGAEVRGIRIGQYRPTKIVADDVEHSDEVYNEQVRAKTESWYFEDVTKAGDTGTNFEFIGTILHKDSLLSKLLKNPAYKGVTFKAIISWSERQDLWEDWRKIYQNIDNQNRLIDSDNFYRSNESEMLKGTSVLWPEKESYLDLMKEYEEIGKRAFMKEKQNDPQGSEDATFTKFHWYREGQQTINGKLVDGFIMEESGKFIPLEECICIGALDPATGQEKQKKTGDYSVIIVAYKHIQTGRVFIHWESTKKDPPTVFIKKVFDAYEKYKFEKFAIETNLFRNILLQNIILEQKERSKKTGNKIAISFYDVLNTENKHERIYRIEPKVTHGYISFNRALSKEFMNMFEAFPNKDSHDDAPDCTEILWNLANNRYKPSELNISAMSMV